MAKYKHEKQGRASQAFQNWQVPPEYTTYQAYPYETTWEFEPIQRVQEDKYTYDNWARGLYVIVGAVLILGVAYSWFVVPSTTTSSDTNEEQFVNEMYDLNYQFNFEDLPASEELANGYTYCQVLAEGYTQDAAVELIYTEQFDVGTSSETEIDDRVFVREMLTLSETYLCP